MTYDKNEARKLFDKRVKAFKISACSTSFYTNDTKLRKYIGENDYWALQALDYNNEQSFINPFK